MKNKPLISVIVPAYNEEKNISACLTALTNQKTDVPYEVILVDNNSSDKTGEIGKKFGVRVVREERQGRAFARQRGADAAKGEILAFTEADCFPPSNWVDYIADYFKTHSSIIGFAGSYRFTSSTPFLTFIGPITLSLTSFLYKLFTGNHTFRGTNFAVKKSVFKKIKGFNREAVPFDDIELGIRTGKYGPIHFLPHLYVKTSDRRVRGRILKFCWEFLTSYPRIFLFRQKGSDDYYEPIR